MHAQPMGGIAASFAGVTTNGATGTIHTPPARMAHAAVRRPPCSTAKARDSVVHATQLATAPRMNTSPSAGPIAWARPRPSSSTATPANASAMPAKRTRLRLLALERHRRQVHADGRQRVEERRRASPSSAPARTGKRPWFNGPARKP